MSDRTENDDLSRVHLYRDLVLRYEAAHAQINALFRLHPGGTEDMSPDEFARYRDLARQRDELLNEMRVMEQLLLEDDSAMTE